MITQAEIEQSVRSNFPIIFGQSESVDTDVYLKKFRSLVNFAATATKPFMRAETTRYQSILLYVSLVFVSISLLELDTLCANISETLPTQ
jgi:hypothetical protein